ncbi:MAG: hypoxanthine phosphoribosyltransferase [Bacilli bacterium]|nr:hypoxanthine phosphoribosyltransferase [Bacilli bacterium]MDD4076393.1 hypoxanthine phosphoribosyltransferase [Bacilli bacterium]MDD4389095.1 hypoxanthine phosphoribosyltransferase [Bacilli bacterium]
MKNNFIEEIILTHEEIADICKKFGEEITEEYQDKRPILVGLLKGSVPFMSELMKYIKCDMEIDFIQASSYSGVKSTGAVMVLKDMITPVKDRHILLVEDIVDTGLTLREVMNLFQDRGAASIEIITLLNKPDGRTVNTVVPKYIGKTIPNKFVVGFGLDYNELYRNLDYVGVLKEAVYKK